MAFGSGTLRGKVQVVGANGAMTYFNGARSTNPQNERNTCTAVAAGDNETIDRGHIIQNVPAGGSPGVRGAVHAKVCEDTAGNLSLLPGSGPFKI